MTNFCEWEGEIKSMVRSLFCGNSKVTRQLAQIDQLSPDLIRTPGYEPIYVAMIRSTKGVIYQNKFYASQIIWLKKSGF